MTREAFRRRVSKVRETHQPSDAGQERRLPPGNHAESRAQIYPLHTRLSAPCGVGN